MLVGAHQSFQTKNLFFFGNNRSLPSFGYRILHNLISTTKLLRN